jgi:hypothetical protein
LSHPQDLCYAKLPEEGRNKLLSNMKYGIDDDDDDDDDVLWDLTV